MEGLQDILYGEALQEADLAAIVNRMAVDVQSPLHPQPFGRFTRAYAFTNGPLDTICGTADIANHHGKRVLSIAEPDYMLTAIGQGCSEIIGIDISLISCFFAELKFAGAMELDYHQYMAFFGVKNTLEMISADFSGMVPEKIRGLKLAMFSESNYAKLRHRLSDTARTFFDKVIGHYYKNGKKPIPAALHYLENIMPADKLNYFGYLKSEKSYSEVKRKLMALGMPLLLPFNLRDAISKFQNAQGKFDNGKFDIIYLSNALDDYSAYGNIRDLVAGLTLIASENSLIIGYEMSSGTTDKVIEAGLQIAVQPTPASARIFYGRVNQVRGIAVGV